jgi:TonB family protein
MKLLLAILLLFFPAGQTTEKWECRGDSEPLPKEGLRRLKPSELKERMVSCAVPHLPLNIDAWGTVVVEVQVDEEGNVWCARAVSGGSPIMKRAALDAAMKWKFRPLIFRGKAKPYSSLLPLVVHWDITKAEKQCPKEKRRA